MILRPANPAKSYDPSAPSLAADRPAPAACDVLCTIELLLEDRNTPPEVRMEAIVQYAMDYRRRLAGTPGAWLFERGRLTTKPR